MKLNRVKSAIGFSNTLEERSRENYLDVLKFLLKFTKIFNEETAKLPYHINLIDELHADENSHSRIFAKLLRYKTEHNYPFLEKFLNEICGFNVYIEKPVVEKVDSCGRIDIPIFDNKFVVVIENKITDKAPDQNTSNGGQLARYIETIQNGYSRRLDEIYIVYTPKFTREPTEEVWKSKDGFSYKKKFKPRFRSLSYRDVIYPWLKTDVLPSIDVKNIYLYSAVEQYIDHLEGLFSLRIINKKMNMRLQEFIKKELGLNDDQPEEALEVLSEKETELENAISQIQQLKSNYQRQILTDHFMQWEKLLKLDFPNFKIVGDKFIQNKSIINVGLKFAIEKKEFTALIECNNWDGSTIYFGVGRHFSSIEKHEIPELLKSILNENELSDPEEFWYGWKFTSLENAYIELKSLINQLISKT